MTDYLDVNVETLAKIFRKRASGMRRLAALVLPGDCFQTNLLALALDYDRQAEELERGDAPSP
jgi:hypothetical protein